MSATRPLDIGVPAIDDHSKHHDAFPGLIMFRFICGLVDVGRR